MLIVRNLSKHLTKFNCHNNLIRSKNLTRSLLLRPNAKPSVQVQNFSQLSGNNNCFPENDKIQFKHHLHTTHAILQENGEAFSLL